MSDSMQIVAADLLQLARLLRKYCHDGQAEVVEGILASFRSAHPDYKRLSGIDMWGGSGAVWEVNLTQSSPTIQGSADDMLFREIIVRLASAMDGLGIGTERSRFISTTFRRWLKEGH